MNYKTGQCYEVKMSGRRKRFTARPSVKAFIELGDRLLPNPGKSTIRYEVKVINGYWPYQTITIAQLNTFATSAPSAKVLYGKSQKK